MKNRQLELLIYMLQHKKSTQQALADHFEVSRKTIERDIDRLSSVGVPIHCQQGSGGGVILEDDYTFDHSFFSPEDIGHMVTALHIAKTFTANPQNNEVFQKLLLMNPDLTSFFQENVSRHVFLDLYAPPVDFEKDIFTKINQCLDLKRYATINDVFEVVPLSYVYKLDGIHLFCHKDTYKLIKISDIASFMVSEVEFEGEFITYDQCQKNFQNLF